MSFAFYGTCLLLLIFTRSSATVADEKKVDKDLVVKLPCSKIYCFTSCGGSGLEYLDLQITGFPMVPNAKESNFNISFIPRKTITYIVATVNYSISVNKFPNTTPITLFKTFIGCGAHRSSRFHCPLLAGKKENISQSFSLEGAYDLPLRVGVQLFVVAKLFDQNNQLILCVKGEPV
ncbi:uncharacterized protein LOC134180796 [Corticium candelabrum]|uniref:uncharacterized protein LOC134180796 n=1 Tax=Corticium candelabrum TaxID=121492 RepID=UPI002E265F81|nr:uncharacterized protein LOC134180796 [Corticium candelabrum]